MNRVVAAIAGIAVASLLFVFPALAGGEGTAASERIMSGGIITVEKTELRQDPSDTSKVIQELLFGEPFYILGERENGNAGRRGEPAWYEILLPDKKTHGWIPDEAATKSRFWDSRFPHNGFASLYYNVGLTLSIRKQYDSAEKLFKSVLEAPSGTQIVVNDTWGTHIAEARTRTLGALAEMSRSNREYEKSIEYYLQMAEHESTAVAARAWSRILTIHLGEPRNPDKVLEAGYVMLRRFPNVATWVNDEYLLHADIAAAGAMLRTLKGEGASGNEFIAHGEGIIDLSQNPTTAIIGYLAKCEGYRRLGQHETMADTMSCALKKWPTAFMPGFKQPSRDCAGEGVALVVESLLEDLEDESRALEFCDDLISETSNDTLLWNLLLARAVILDLGQASKETVMDAYRKTSFDGVSVYMTPFSRFFYYTRLDSVRAFREYQAEVTSPEIAAKSRPDRKAKDLFWLKNGDPVLVLYGDPDPDDERWLKVQAHGKRFGWLERSALSEERSP